MTDQIETTISTIFKELHLDAFWSVSQISTPLSMSLYSEWIDQGMHASMQYLKDHQQTKSNPDVLLPAAKSAIVVAINYKPHPRPIEDFALSGIGIAGYAKGQDYHYWLTEALSKVSAQLKAQFPNEEFRVFSDKYPVLERDLAYRAGLGWIGKNSLLISRKEGSFFLLGEIFTTLDLESKPQLSPDHCGTCDRCIKACPTQAINNQRTLDSRKCISYWTIEAKDIPNQQLRSQFGEWIFGCDICQSVCPWNRPLTPEKTAYNPEKFQQDLKWILNSSNKELQKALSASPLARSAGNKLKRNALIAIENLKIHSLKAEVEKLADHSKLGTLAKEVLQKLNA